MYFVKGDVRMKRYYILHIFEIDCTTSIVCKNLNVLLKAIRENNLYLDEYHFYIEKKWLSCDEVKKLGYVVWSDKDE